jgi:hypothetical protein
MRTTIRIDDTLYRQVKARAAEQGRTVGKLIEDAVREAVKPRPRSTELLAPLPVFGGGGTLPGIDLTDNAALLDAMEEGEPVVVLR